ncbi:MAG: hypothetical protein HKM07_05195 [Chlamydiae bacterium]|nr:hypothetical protein [Chlamydiota bacterium]
MMAVQAIPTFTTLEQVVARAQELPLENHLPDFSQRIHQFKRSVEFFARSVTFLPSDELDARKGKLQNFRTLLLNPATSNQVITQAFWGLPEQIRNEYTKAFPNIAFLEDKRCLLPIVVSQLQWVDQEIPRTHEYFMQLLRVKMDVNQLLPPSSDIHQMWWETQAEYIGFKVEMQRRMAAGALIGHVNTELRFTNEQMIHLADGQEMDAHFAFDHRFILTQCPRQNTVDNFWRMIEEQASSTVVMLNEMHEYIGFAQYFPIQMNVPHFFGDVQVSLLEQNDIHDVNISRRSYSVTSAGIEPRVVTHLHYRHWSDGGVGDTARVSSLIDLVNQAQQGRQTPVTIHCGAGMARTPTFAVILKLAQDHQAGIQNLSIRDSVAYLRDFNTGRGPGMVIEKQYLFCHSALQFRIGDQ